VAEVVQGDRDNGRVVQELRPCLSGAATAEVSAEEEWHRDHRRSDLEKAQELVIEVAAVHLPQMIDFLELEDTSVGPVERLLVLWHSSLAEEEMRKDGRNRRM
jgi:hypothetical protein